jgi:hypothetical protein
VTLVLIGCLAIAAMYLGKRWSEARMEVVELQTRVATLKRELTRRRR